MITIRIKASGEIRQVTRNIAFDLIDRKLADVYQQPVVKPQVDYPTRQLRPRRLR